MVVVRSVCRLSSAEVSGVSTPSAGGPRRDLTGNIIACHLHAQTDCAGPGSGFATLLGAEMMSSPELMSIRDSQQLNHAKSYVYKLDATGLAALTGHCPSASAKAQVQR